MTHFDENAHPRGDTGKFTTKAMSEADGGTEAELVVAEVETMQTDAPVFRSTHLNSMTRTLNHFMFAASKQHDTFDLDTDQPYQRGEVWGLRRRRELIRSYMSGVPVPGIIINDRASAGFNDPNVPKDKHFAQAIVDGKQRITTLLAFTQDRFSVPASWFEDRQIESTESTPDGEYVRFSSLSKSGQRSIESLQVPTHEGQFKTLAEEERLFTIINFGGVPQGEIDDDFMDES